MPCRCDFYDEPQPPKQDYESIIKHEKSLTCRAQSLVYKLYKLVDKLPDELRLAVEREIGLLYSHKLEEAQQDQANRINALRARIKNAGETQVKIRSLGGLVTPTAIASLDKLRQELVEAEKEVKIPTKEELLG